MASHKDSQEKTADTFNGSIPEIEYVSWDAQDPTHPRNWSIWKKRIHVLLVALITFMTCALFLAGCSFPGY